MKICSFQQFLCSFAVIALIASVSQVASASAIVINEVDADNPGTDVLEFVELFGDPNESLDGLSIVGVNGSDDLTYDTFLFDLDGFTLDANGYFVIGNATVVPAPDLVTPAANNALQNGPDAVVLFTGNAIDFPNDTAPPTGGLVIDVVHYGTNDSADAGLSALYPGAVYVDEGTLGDKDTDSVGRIPNGTGAFQTLDTPAPGSANIPEPGSLALMIAGLAGIAMSRRR